MKAEPMTQARMAQLIAERNSMRRERDPTALRAELAELLADRNYHYARAEAAETEAANTLADLADMKRERDALLREKAERGVPYWATGKIRSEFLRLAAKGLGAPHLYPEEPSQ